MPKILAQEGKEFLINLKMIITTEDVKEKSKDNGFWIDITSKRLMPEVIL